MRWQQFLFSSFDLGSTQGNLPLFYNNFSTMGSLRPPGVGPGDSIGRSSTRKVWKSRCKAKYYMPFMNSALSDYTISVLVLDDWMMNGR
jgi:hypothetical protein